MKSYHAVFLMILGVVASCPDRAQGSTIVFDAGAVYVGAEIATYPGFDTAGVGSNYRIPVKTVRMALQDHENIDQIAFSFLGQQVGMVSLARFKSQDISTAIENKYDERIISAAQEVGIGRRPVAIMAERREDGARFAEVVISPVTVDSVGGIHMVSEITIQIADRVILESELLPAISARAERRHPLGLSSGTEFLIVTTASLAEPASRLAAYRTSLGIRSEVNFIDYIVPLNSGVDDAEKLRNHLVSFHQNGGQYVLLLGDETLLPVRYAYHQNVDTPPALADQIPTDYYFADLTGTWDADGDNVWGERTDDAADLTPELRVGRLPFRTAEQVDTYVDKLILYETNPGYGDRDYLNRAFFVTTDEMRDYGTTGQHAMVVPGLPAGTNVDTSSAVESATGEDLSPVSMSGRDVIATLDSGYGIINVIAHGRMDGFAVRSSGYNNWPKSFVSSAAAGDHGDISHLEPNGRIGFIYSLACDVGGYELDQPAIGQTGVSFVEEALSTPLAGPVAVVAYSRWGWVGSSFMLMKAFWDSVRVNPDRPASEAMLSAAQRFGYYRDLAYGQTFFGDPCLRLHMSRPTGLTATLIDHGSTIEIQVQDETGTPLSSARVVMSESWQVYSDITTDSNGASLFSIPEDRSKTYTIGVTAPGHLAMRAQFTPGSPTGVDDEPGALPDQFSLEQNYPNPFNPSTTVRFSLPERTDVTLSVFNVAGQEVSFLRAGSLPAGEHELVWNGRNDADLPVASGVYFYRIRAGEFGDVRSMVLVR